MRYMIVSEAKKNLKALVEDECLTDNPVVIVTNNKAAILVSQEEWESTQETLHLMSNPANLKDFIDANEQIKKGQGIPIKDIRKYFDCL